MNNLIYKKKLRVHEAVGATSLSESYQIKDCENGQVLASAQEVASVGVKFAKLFLDKGFLPLNIELCLPGGEKILEVERPASLMTSILKNKFWVRNADGKVLCIFEQNFSLLHSKITVSDEHGNQLGQINAGLRNRRFEFRDNNGNLISKIQHVVSSLAKELFTTADDYDIEMQGDSSMTLISLAAALCIDFIFHEG